MVIYLEDCSSEMVSGIELHSGGHCDWSLGASYATAYFTIRREEEPEACESS